MWNNSDRGKGAITNWVATAALVAPRWVSKPLQVVVHHPHPMCLPADKARQTGLSVRNKAKTGGLDHFPDFPGFPALQSQTSSNRLIQPWASAVASVGGAKAFQGLPAPDLVLVTQIHSDHFSVPTLTAVAGDKAKLVGFPRWSHNFHPPWPAAPPP